MSEGPWRLTGPGGSLELHCLRPELVATCQRLAGLYPGQDGAGGRVLRVSHEPQGDSGQSRPLVFTNSQLRVELGPTFRWVENRSVQPIEAYLQLFGERPEATLVAFVERCLRAG